MQPHNRQTDRKGGGGGGGWKEKTERDGKVLFTSLPRISIKFNCDCLLPGAFPLLLVFSGANDSNFSNRMSHAWKILI